jgi:predicted DNA repair protein MutK
VAGVAADRELPVVWAVAKGSFRNKLILVPVALAISAVVPWAVIPLLMLGGAFLCYEGFEKLAHKLLHGKAEDEAHHAGHVHALADPAVDLVAFEKDKIKGAVRTDFILSAEIIVITLGTVAAAPFVTQLTVLAAIAVIMTVGVYGLVAGIVKLDDGGLYLSRKGGIRGAIGGAILKAAPWLMKGLSIAGTVAMFMVGGGILVHGIPGSHELVHGLTHGIAAIPGVGKVLEAITPMLLDALAGVVAGAVILGGMTLMGRAVQAFKAPA